MALRRNFADKPTLTGDLVLLRPVQATDAAGLAACDDETLWLTGSHHRASSLAKLDGGTRPGQPTTTGSTCRSSSAPRGFAHEGTMRDALRWDGQCAGQRLDGGRRVAGTRG